MNELMIKEVDFEGATLLICEDKFIQKFYVGVSDICKKLSMGRGQKDAQIKKVQKDIFLNQGVRKFEIGIFDENNETIGLELNYLPIWLSKINVNGLNNKQYLNLVKILNWSLSEEFNTIKYPTKTYHWEAELRDDIFNIGYFNEYKIIDKEVNYSFGRIDLLAKDKNDNLIVIELKKNKNYNDVIYQTLRYKKGFKTEFNKDIKLVICTLDNDEFFYRKAKENNIEVYIYKRELILDKVQLNV